MHRRVGRDLTLIHVTPSRADRLTCRILEIAASSTAPRRFAAAAVTPAKCRRGRGWRRRRRLPTLSFALTGVASPLTESPARSPGIIPPLIVRMRGRSATEQHRAATPLELFFDLVFVIA